MTVLNAEVGTTSVLITYAGNTASRDRLVTTKEYLHTDDFSAAPASRPTAAAAIPVTNTNVWVGLQHLRTVEPLRSYPPTGSPNNRLL